VTCTNITLKRDTILTLHVDNNLKFNLKYIYMTNT